MIPYFAYGSNMNMERLRERLGREGHQLLGRRRATLHDYRLVSNKKSSLEARVGYANIEPSGASIVEGTLNEMSDAALALLDRIELVPVHYRRVLTSNLVQHQYHLAIQNLEFLFDRLRHVEQEIGDGSPADRAQLRESWQVFLRLLAAAAPHAAEELWSQARGRGLVAAAAWPAPLEEAGQRRSGDSHGRRARAATAEQMEQAA